MANLNQKVSNAVNSHQVIILDQPVNLTDDLEIPPNIELIIQQGYFILKTFINVSSDCPHRRWA